MRYWFNQIVETREGAFVIESVELDDWGLSDIDEPALTAGMKFTTRADAEGIAEALDIRIRPGGPYYGEPVT